MEPVRVLVADDNPVVRAVLRDMFGAASGITVVGEAGDGAEALLLAGALRPDVTLLDHRMPVRDGLSVVPAISAHTRVLMLTRSSGDDVVLAAVRAGAIGYLVHGQFGPEELTRAVHAVAAGQSHLSPTAARAVVAAVRRDEGTRFGLSARERDVMNLIAEGITNAEIAARLVLAPKTVENHVNHVYAKLGVTTRRQAMARWRAR